MLAVSALSHLEDMKQENSMTLLLRLKPVNSISISVMGKVLKCTKVKVKLLP